MSQLPIRPSASRAIASEHIRARGTIALEKVKRMRYCLNYSGTRFLSTEN